MSNSIDTHPVAGALTFRAEDRSLLSFRGATMSLDKQGDHVEGCHLFLSVTYEQYRDIRSQGSFNLKPDICGPLSGGKLDPNRDILITLALKAELLPCLIERGKSAKQAARHLQRLGHTSLSSTADAEICDAPEPLLAADNWLCLSVAQKQPGGETGYRTFWDYLEPAALRASDEADERLAAAIVDFIADWAKAKLSGDSKHITDRVANDVGRFLDGLSSERFSEGPDGMGAGRSIARVAADFFIEEEWSYVELEGEDALVVAFRGNSGQWSCVAQARELERRLIFYSVCPRATPEDRRSRMAELLTRASYGLLIGNFELDLDDGEVRYKTSIDVEGDRLTTALVRQLVHANVTTMDYYLPAIMAVIEQNAAPGDALAVLPGSRVLQQYGESDDTDVEHTD